MKNTQENSNAKTAEKLYVIHFAGGAWENYTTIKSTYEVDPDLYYQKEYIIYWLAQDKDS